MGNNKALLQIWLCRQDSIHAVWFRDFVRTVLVENEWKSFVGRSCSFEFCWKRHPWYITNSLNASKYVVVLLFCFPLCVCFVPKQWGGRDRETKTERQRQRQRPADRQWKRVCNWILTSCQPHSVTAEQKERHTYRKTHCQTDGDRWSLWMRNGGRGHAFWRCSSLELMYLLSIRMPNDSNHRSL